MRRRLRLHRPSARGLALTLTVIALGTALILLAEGVRYSGQLQYDKHNRHINLSIINQYLLSGEAVVSIALEEDEANSDTDTNDELWAGDLPPYPIGDGILLGKIRERNGCFNINNLDGANSEDYILQFERLLKELKLKPELAHIAADWIDPNAEARAVKGGVEDAYYSGAQDYQAANTYLVSISELRLLKDVDMPIFAKLTKEVCALPGKTKVNVNTASEVVLKSLSEKIKGVRKPRIIYENLNDFLKDYELQATDIKVPIDVKSEFFQSRISVTLGNETATLYSLLRRSGSGVKVLFRSRETF